MEEGGNDKTKPKDCGFRSEERKIRKETRRHRNKMTTRGNGSCTEAVAGRIGSGFEIGDEKRVAEVAGQEREMGKTEQIHAAPIWDL